VSARGRTAAERAHGTLVVGGSRWLARSLGRGLTRLVITGTENLPAGGVLLAVNHASYLDGPLLYGALPRPGTFLVKAEVFRGVVGWYLHKIGQIPVRRGVAEREPLVTALAVLAEGGIVGIFPEGTRRADATESSALLEVRHGIAYLALRSGCPVVPVACLGTERVLPRGRALPAWRRPVTVAFGPPLPVATERPTRQAIAVTATRIRDLLNEHLDAAATSSIRTKEPNR
jgi:1-acyl-sn-glycerol-3-phosphate acyltransferase